MREGYIWFLIQGITWNGLGGGRWNLGHLLPLFLWQTNRRDLPFSQLDLRFSTTDLPISTSQCTDRNSTTGGSKLLFILLWLCVYEPKNFIFMWKEIIQHLLSHAKINVTKQFSALCLVSKQKWRASYWNIRGRDYITVLLISFHYQWFYMHMNVLQHIYIVWCPLFSWSPISHIKYSW